MSIHDMAGLTRAQRRHAIRLYETMRNARRYEELDDGEQECLWVKAKYLARAYGRQNKTHRGEV